MTGSEARSAHSLVGRIAGTDPPPLAPDPALDALGERLAEGDDGALRAFAERLAPRVRRVARAFMGDGVDTDDAAQHALIELVRARRRAPADEGIERWADRGAALSVMRFARAVRRREGYVSGAPAAAPIDPPRTFEGYLMALGEPSREVLLLRHALGLRMGELPAALCCSMRVAKERLLVARRELRGLVRRRASPGRDLSPAALRWCALRDRDAAEEPLSDEERDELARLEEREAEIWAYVAQVRALELYFASHARQVDDDDRALVDSAVAALEISAKAVLVRALEGGDELERTLDPEGPSVSRTIALGGSAMLVIACCAALLVRSPRGATVQAKVVASVAPAAVPAKAPPAHLPEPLLTLQPRIEPLAQARVTTPDPRLRAGGRLLPPGTALHHDDVVEATDRTGCFSIADAATVCLAAGSTARIHSLLAHAPALRLVRGRLVANAKGPLRLELEGVRVELADGAAGLELSATGDTLRVRAIAGRMEIIGAVGSRLLEQGHELSYRPSEGSLEVASTSRDRLAADRALFAQAMGASLPSPEPGGTN